MILNYHDTVWGKPIIDSNQLFRNLALQIFQGGLQWQLILGKVTDLDIIFHEFDIAYVASLTINDIEKLCQNPRIIRNQSKINAIIKNAQLINKLMEQGISFSDYCWKSIDYSVVDLKVKMEIDFLENNNILFQDVLTQFKSTGFERVGLITLTNFLLASGLINGHCEECFRYKEVGLD